MKYILNYTNNFKGFINLKFMGEAKALDEIRSFLDRKKNYVVSRLKNLEIIEEEKIISPDPSSWHLTLRCEDVHEKNNFSKENLSDFKREVNFSNHMIDKIVGIVLNEYINRHVTYTGRGIGNIIEDKLCSDKLKVPFDFLELTKPTKITWETYVLPNFLDSPQLGKKVNFTFFTSEGQGNILDSSIEFRINHRRREDGSNSFDQFYLVKDTRNETFSKDVLAFLENEVRDGYSIKYKHIRG